MSKRAGWTGVYGQSGILETVISERVQFLLMTRSDKGWWLSSAEKVLVKELWSLVPYWTKKETKNVSGLRYGKNWSSSNQNEGCLPEELIGGCGKNRRGIMWLKNAKWNAVHYMEKWRQMRGNGETQHRSQPCPGFSNLLFFWSLQVSVLFS